MLLTNWRPCSLFHHYEDQCKRYMKENREEKRREKKGREEREAGKEKETIGVMEREKGGNENMRERGNYKV